jgi:hypothetical protein
MEDMMKIAEAFGLKPTYVYKTKYFYTAKCGREEYRIIPTTLSEERLNEIYGIKSELFGAGLKVCDKPVLTLDGTPLAVGEEGSYIVSEAVRGHNLDFENGAEVKRAFAAMGDMHNVLKRIGCSAEGVDILQGYKKGAAKLKSIKKQLGCAKRLKDCDVEYIKRYKDYYELAQNAVSVLEGLFFGTANVSPIHGAIKEDNIFVGHYVVLTDWELCRAGHFMEDVAQLITRYIRKFAYYSGCFLTLEEILDEYTLHNPASDSELAVLYALLMYPKRYISVASKYYDKAHRFTPVGVKRKFDEEYEQREFYGKYIGL